MSAACVHAFVPRDDGEECVTPQPSTTKPAALAIWFRGTPLRAAKRFLHGTHRCVAPEETLERARPHLARAGITRLADVTGLDRIGLPTVIAHRPNSPTLANAAGKGYTVAAAATSGAMEALEIYHAENVRAPVLFASHADLDADGRTIRRDDLPFTRRPLFSAHRREPWVAGWDLIQQREVFVPYALVSMTRHPAQKPAMAMPFPMGSNGLASGNHLLEAINAALLEVIERDATACQRAAERRGRHSYARVPLESVEHELVRDLLERLEHAKVGAALFDYTVDTGVPVYVAHIYDRVNRHTGIYRGYGAHLDPAIAMIRALTEAAQSRAVYIAGSRDDFFRHDSFSNRVFDDAAGVASIETSGKGVAPLDRRPIVALSFEEDVGVLLDRLRAVGIEHAIVVDLTHEELDIPVVRVVVPGLEGYLFQYYAPGRRAERARTLGIPEA
jgi:YcaO-like protein with predicted kinase domain